MPRPIKSVVKPGDPNRELSISIAQAITNYLKQGRRELRLTISLNDDEMAMLERAAKIQKQPKATVMRACAMLGLAQYLDATTKRD